MVIGNPLCITISEDLVTVLKVWEIGIVKSTDIFYLSCFIWVLRFSIADLRPPPLINITLLGIWSVCITWFFTLLNYVIFIARVCLSIVILMMLVYLQDMSGLLKVLRSTSLAFLCLTHSTCLVHWLILDDWGRYGARSCQLSYWNPTRCWGRLFIGSLLASMIG